jgi:dolichol-phosphate mannosyltransferase
MTTPLLSLIIPTFNESHNITTLIHCLRTQLQPIDYEIIVVDDTSPDGTATQVASLAAQDPRIHLEVRKGQRGLSSAVLHGMAVSRGDILAVMDADLSHDERLLPILADAVKDGADLAVGSRRIPGGGADQWPWHRKLMSNLATRMTFMWLRVPFSDPMSGFFAIKRSVYESCRDRLAPQGYKILLEIYCKSKPKTVKEYPFIFKDRWQDHSKLTLRVMLQFVQSLIRLRLDS